MSMGAIQQQPPPDIQPQRNGVNNTELRVYMAEQFATMKADIGNLIRAVDKLSALQVSVTGMDIKQQQQRKEIDDHDKRLDALEQRIWFAMGGASIIGALVGYFLPRLIGG